MKMKKKPCLLPGLRSRVHASGIKYYYYEPPNSIKRAEIALGSDLKPALMKRAKLLLNFEEISLAHTNNLDFILLLYQNVEIPIKPIEKQSENMVAVEYIRKFSVENNLGFRPDFREFYAKDYYNWRGVYAQLRAKREWSLTSAIFNWFDDIQNKFLKI